MARVMRQKDGRQGPDIKPRTLQGKTRRAVANMAADNFGLDGKDRVLNGVLAPAKPAVRVCKE
jgi:hypothetical protein